MEVTSYEEAVRYLESFIGKVVFKVDKEYLKHHDPLERMKVLLSLLGNPQNKFPSVLVGGTSGKGSTAYLISHILTQAGYKTGFTVSPHLQKINERLQINNKPITDRKFVVLLKSLILPSIRQMSKMEVSAPSYFEILIAMAFLYFAKQRVDIVIAEVGMGGEFDATNTLNPLIAVLTNVSLDHTNVLGKTVEKIARTKAGIIKYSRLPHVASDARSTFIADSEKSRSLSERLSRSLAQSSQDISRSAFSSLASGQAPIVITAVKQPSVIKIVENRCEDVGAKLFRLGKDFNYKIKKESREGFVFDLTIDNDRGVQLNDLRASLLGDYQVENASLAIRAVIELKKYGFEISEDAIRKALKTAFFPGRFEVLRLASLSQDKTSSTLVLDGAHNPTKMKEFLKSLKKLFPKERKVFIVGFKFDKDIPKMLRQITRVADRIIITEFSRATDMGVSASADASNIKNQISSLRQGFGRQAKIKYGGEIILEKDSKKALDLALNIPSVVVVTGSLYLVGEVRDML